MIEVLWRKQQFFAKLEKMKITKKMLQFYSQNKNKQKKEDMSNKSEDKEQLTQVSKNYKNNTLEKSGHISIRNEIEEEEKGITNNVQLQNEHQNNNNKSLENRENEEEKNDIDMNYERFSLFWQKIKREFRIENIFSVINYLNIKLNGVAERDIPKKVFFSY